MNQWAELVTSRSRRAAVYDVYRYAFSRLLSVGVVDRITFVDTAAACQHPVAKDATPCDDDGLTDGCPQQVPVSAQTSIVTFCVSLRRRKMYCGHARLCVSLSVCLSVRGRMPTLLHGPGCNLGSGRGCPPSCALFGGFAIGARVALLWQHNANPSYKLASIP